MFNQGGSHYTRLSEDIDQGFVLSNFSNYFNTGQEFIPLVVKTDADYNSGCNDVNVTGELEIAIEEWDVQDIVYEEEEGGEVVNFSPESDFEYTEVDVECESFPMLEALFTVEDAGNGPVGTFNFTNNSIGQGAYFWTFGDGGTSTAENPTYTYTENGDF